MESRVFNAAKLVVFISWCGAAGFFAQHIPLSRNSIAVFVFLYNMATHAQLIETDPPQKTNKVKKKKKKKGIQFLLFVCVVPEVGHCCNADFLKLCTHKVWISYRAARIW